MKFFAWQKSKREQSQLPEYRNSKCKRKTTCPKKVERKKKQNKNKKKTKQNAHKRAEENMQETPLQTPSLQDQEKIEKELLKL